jgi:hypothetical protein
MSLPFKERAPAAGSKNDRFEFVLPEEIPAHRLPVPGFDPGPVL